MSQCENCELHGGGMDTALQYGYLLVALLKSCDPDD